MQTELDSVKIQLYHLLLTKDVNLLSRNEVDIMYFLSKEPCIQNLIEKEFQKQVSKGEKL